jgi:thioredoxin-like negative regulator of GroEL
MNQQKELCQMLSEVGFIASRYMMFEKAANLHGAIEVAYPETEAPAIGQAYNLICQQSTAEAIGLLAKYMEKKEDASDLLKGFYGLALFENGSMTQAEEVLQSVSNSDDPIAKSMASDLLNMVSKN